MAKNARRGADGKGRKGKQHHNHKAKRERRKTRGVTIIVGELWPEGIEVRVEQPHRDVKDYVIIGVAILFGILAVAADANTLKEIFRLIWDGIMLMFRFLK